MRDRPASSCTGQSLSSRRRYSRMYRKCSRTRRSYPHPAIRNTASVSANPKYNERYAPTECRVTPSRLARGASIPGASWPKQLPDRRMIGTSKIAAPNAPHQRRSAYHRTVDNRTQCRRAGTFDTRGWPSGRESPELFCCTAPGKLGLSTPGRTGSTVCWLPNTGREYPLELTGSLS